VIIENENKVVKPNTIEDALHLLQQIPYNFYPTGSRVIGNGWNSHEGSDYDFFCKDENNTITILDTFRRAGFSCEAMDTYDNFQGTLAEQGCACVIRVFAGNTKIDIQVMMPGLWFEAKKAVNEYLKTNTSINLLDKEARSHVWFYLIHFYINQKYPDKW
jgi:hypothetical protein